jgi:hypothetical protein
MQAQSTFQPHMDVHALFRPLFSGINKDMPSCLIGIDSKVNVGFHVLMQPQADCVSVRRHCTDTVLIRIKYTCASHFCQVPN